MFAMASRLMGRLARNLATIENSDVAWSGFRDRPVPSFSDGKRDFHRLDKSSIAKIVPQESREEEDGKSVSLHPGKKTLLA